MSDGAPAPYVAVIGDGDATREQRDDALEVGALLARAGAVVVTGGLGGVMEAASRGAAEAGGLTLGLLPGEDRAAANPHVTVAVPTGLGELRNGLVVRCADAAIAVGGGAGTLSEIALARRMGRPVIALGSFDVLDVQVARTPRDAVRAALSARP